MSKTKTKELAIKNALKKVLSVLPEDEVEIDDSILSHLLSSSYQSKHQDQMNIKEYLEKIIQEDSLENFNKEEQLSCKDICNSYKNQKEAFNEKQSNEITITITINLN